MKKRSFSIAGHRTSLALEEEFWTSIQEQAREEGVSLAALLARIDANRKTRNLSSAVRVHVLVRARK